MRIYIAGPDVFRPDLDAWAAAVRTTLAASGHQALIPIDGGQTTAPAIYRANVELIRSADAVLARLDAFRGDEPDSGTAFEVGFAAALGKPVVAYLADGRALKDKQRRGAGTPERDADGWQIEDFGLPLNLMLACSCRVVIGGIDEAIKALEAL